MPTNILWFSRQQVRWSRSFFRESVWTCCSARPAVARACVWWGRVWSGGEGLERYLVGLLDLAVVV